MENLDTPSPWITRRLKVVKTERKKALTSLERRMNLSPPPASFKMAENALNMSQYASFSVSRNAFKLAQLLIKATRESWQDHENGCILRLNLIPHDEKLSDFFVSHFMQALKNEKYDNISGVEILHLDMHAQRSNYSGITHYPLRHLCQQLVGKCNPSAFESYFIRSAMEISYENGNDNDKDNEYECFFAALTRHLVEKQSKKLFMVLENLPEYENGHEDEIVRFLKLFRSVDLKIRQHIKLLLPQKSTEFRSLSALDDGYSVVEESLESHLKE